MPQDDEKRGGTTTIGPLFRPDYAVLIAEELFRAMLPASEDAFRQELSLWHPELDPRRYIISNRYPRCWVMTAALICAAEFTEYARFLFESLRQSAAIFHPHDPRIAESIEAGGLSMLKEESWRGAICGLGSFLYFFGPQTLRRAFAVGLNLAFVQPETVRAFVNVVRTTAQEGYDRQVAGAAAVVRQHPIASQMYS